MPDLRTKEGKLYMEKLGAPTKKALYKKAPVKKTKAKSAKSYREESDKSLIKRFLEEEED